MNQLPSKPRFASRRSQGAALVVVLILLLLMTLLGLASLRGTLLEERMGANLLDRSLAFQSAEAALRVGEARLAAFPLPVFPAVGCVAGLCAQPVPAIGTPDRWLDPAFAGWINAGVNLGGGAAVQPQYFIENLGLGPKWVACDQAVPVSPSCMRPRYRVTARSSAVDRAQLILQSNFAAP
ncbi:MAG: PilX N-terminal domain-containing pilus assembly protein [Lysobacterales bacterium]